MSLAAIHVLKNQLGLSDAEYRALLRSAAGVDSAKDLDEDGDRAVMARLYAIRDGRTVAPNRRKSPTEAKIWALWYELREFLPIPERKAAYLLGFVRRAANNQNLRQVADLAGLSPREAYQVIEALKRRIEQERGDTESEVPF